MRGFREKMGESRRKNLTILSGASATPRAGPKPLTQGIGGEPGRGGASSRCAWGRYGSEVRSQKSEGCLALAPGPDLRCRVWLRGGDKFFRTRAGHSESENMQQEFRGIRSGCRTDHRLSYTRRHGLVRKKYALMRQ